MLFILFGDKNKDIKRLDMSYPCHTHPTVVFVDMAKGVTGRNHGRMYFLSSCLYICCLCKTSSLDSCAWVFPSPFDTNVIQMVCIICICMQSESTVLKCKWHTPVPPEPFWSEGSRCSQRMPHFASRRIEKCLGKIEVFAHRLRSFECFWYTYTLSKYINYNYSIKNSYYS